MDLHFSKTKSIVFGTNHSLNPKPQLHIVMNNVGGTKLLGVTLDFQLSWSKHTDTIVAKMGRSVSIIMCCSAFLAVLSTRQVLKDLVLPHLDYCSVVWSGAIKRDLDKLQLAPNRAAHLALRCTQRSNINNVNRSWLKV